MTPVRNATRSCFVFMTAIMFGGLPALGQELPVPGAADLERALAAPAGTGPQGYSALHPESIGAGQVIVEDDLVQPAPFYETPAWAESYELWDCESVPHESSGTWLRRGFWYAEVDAVVMNRFWERRDLFLATDDQNTEVGLSAFLANTNRKLFLKGAHPGTDAGARFTLGRFLFRDIENRDHTAEFTAYGAGDFVHDNSVSSVQPNMLFVPFEIDATNLSFDNSNRQRAVYTSRFNNFEVNYRVKRRLRKDQMVLDPNGGWYRRANPTITKEFLIGLRYLDLTERLDWSAVFVDNAGLTNATGNYFIRTDNNMFGIQLGGGGAYETARWSIGLLGKAGVYINDAKGRTRFDRSDIPAAAFNLRMADEQLSFIGESRLTTKWHLRPNFSLRASYEALYVTSVALATHQITFNPVFDELASSGDPFYHGASFGFEGYW